MYTLIYDFETSGLNQYHSDIIEIGCKCIETGEEFNTLLKPLSNKLISDRITNITGITNKMLKENGIEAKAGYIEFFNFIKQYFDIDNQLILIAHNGHSFDDIFLRRIHRYLLGEELDVYDDMMSSIKLVDSLLIARYLYPERHSHSMDNMCKMFNITNQAAHRAMGDVNALVDLWIEMIKKIKNEKIDISGSNLRYITYL